MKRPTCVFAAVLLFSFAVMAGAQTPDPPAEKPWSAGSIDFSGLIDGYFGYNFNHPASRTSQLRNFDVAANQFTLNMAKVTLNHDADSVGFRVDLGFGRAFDMIHGAEAAPGIFRNLEQAYLSVKPKNAGGLQVDFGKFVTSAGAEVIETHLNWNYSRSLLFAWAIPYYHFGVRAAVPVGGHFTAGAQLVNGWNNVEENNNGKTLGLTGAFTSSKASWFNNYYVGPEKANSKGLRQVYDTTLLLTPCECASLYVNVDYGADKTPGGPTAKWAGVAGAARYQVNSWFALAPRLEYFNDMDGFSTGAAQKLKEFTITGEFKAAEGVLARLEYRRDWSDVNYFERGTFPASYNNQSTLLVGFVAYFGPKR